MDVSSESMRIREEERSTDALAPTRKIKKIPPPLRRKRPSFSLEPIWYTRLVWRMRDDSQFLRSLVQFAFVLLCAWIGYEFYLFMEWGMTGGARPFVERPPGVEGFLPISALISFKYWLLTGIVNGVHPSGLLIFIAILALGLLFKKSFCGWLCPIGTLSESLWMLGRKLFGKNVSVAKWVDYPLRSLKYLILAFFAWSIGQMDVPALQQFIYSPYNKVADIKMYQFFANISLFAFWTIFLLVVLSVPIRNFWCRYLCPYGALLGALSWLSPLKVTRKTATCIDCELCTKVCPSAIKVHKVERVWSDECMSCYECIEVCPVKDTLFMATKRNAKPVPGWVFATLVAGVFVGITGLAILSGHWQNNISKEEYLKRFEQIDSPIYQHFRGEVPAYGPND